MRLQRDQAKTGGGRPIRHGLAAVLAVTVLCAPGAAASAKEHAGEIAAPAMAPESWRIDAAEHRFERYRGRDALMLRNGVAWLRGEELEDGVIELELAVSEDFGFPGVAFRASGDEDYEHLYVRPHLDGEPDASQYTPVLRGLGGWQIYHGAGFWAPVDFTFERWMHLEIRVAGRRAELSVDGNEPALVVPQLLRDPVSGAVGLTASGAPARFADVRVRRGPVLLRGGESQASTRRAGSGGAADGYQRVRRFRVSRPFAESRFANRTLLDLEELPAPGWSELAVEPNGIANLSRLHAAERAGAGSEDDAPRNTVLAALTLRARRDHTALARFGFSDRVRVYCNGRLLFAGNDGYRTRDHRFLGTVGPWYQLALPLRRGDNELVLAVSEDFGGWAALVELPADNELALAP